MHGVMDRGATFLNVTRRLPNDSWIVYDRRGYGRSVSSNVSTFDDHVSDLVALVRRESDGTSFVLVGHSLGGTIALAAAAQTSESVAAVVIHEAPLPWLDWWPIRDADGRRIEDESPTNAVVRVMQRTAGDQVWESLPETVRQKRISEGPTMVAELVTARERCPFKSSDLEMPVVVCRGSRSSGHREQAQHWLLHELPNASSVVIDGAAHNVQASHPDAFAQIVQTTVNSVSRSEGS